MYNVDAYTFFSQVGGLKEFEDINCKGVIRTEAVN